ncbi:hypothetical protein P8452_00783 [Trifolium repens]|jgi:hypothetical protein|nr:hypothetical protein P8452_00783 [Trifolium repens]
MYSESDTSLHGVERPKADLEPKPKRMKSVCSEPISPKRFWELKHYGMKRPKAIWEEGLVLTPAMSKDYFSILSDLESEQSRLLHAELNLSLKKSIEEDELYLEQSRNLSLYDAIPRPRTSRLAGGSPVDPLLITQTNRPLLVDLSWMALNRFNQDFGATFVFRDLIKCTCTTHVGRIHDDGVFRHDPTDYYITFAAKPSGHSFHCLTIFQAHVSVPVDECSSLFQNRVVHECRIKP